MDVLQTANGATRVLAEEYTQSARIYERYWSPIIRPAGEQLLEALPLTGAGRILDLGTGSGALIPYLRARAPHALLVGVDRSGGMLQVAREKSRIPLLVMDAHQLAFRSHSFDVAVLAYVLFHLPDPLQGLRQTLRVLRPGGTVGLITWKYSSPSPGAEIWNEQLEAYGAGPDPLPAEVLQHTLMDTAEKVEALLAEAGFSSVSIWGLPLHHQYEPAQLIALQLGQGPYWRRLATLPAGARKSCEEHMRKRLGALSAEERTFSAELILATASRPGSA